MAQKKLWLTMLCATLSCLTGSLAVHMNAEPTPTQSGQADNSFAIATVAADQSDKPAPLKILSITSDAKGDLMKEAEVWNVSDKVVVSYRLGWHIRNAVPVEQGFDGGSESYGSHSAKPVQTRLEPLARELTPPQGLVREDLKQRLRAKGAAKRIFVLVGVAEVVFEDGTRWSADPASFSKIVKRKPSDPQGRVNPSVECPLGVPPPVCMHIDSVGLSMEIPNVLPGGLQLLPRSSWFR